MIKTKLDYTSFKIATYKEPEATRKKVKLFLVMITFMERNWYYLGSIGCVMSIYITDVTPLTTLNECWVYEFIGNDWKYSR